MATEYEPYDLPVSGAPDEEDIYGASDEDLEVMPPDDFIEEARIERDGREMDEPEYDIDLAREAFLKHIRETYQSDVGADEHNRTAQLEDLEFLAGDQWPDAIRRAREIKHKPVMTLNRLPATVALVVNQRRANEAGIVVLPDEGGDKKIAQIRQGLTRSIEKQSHAQNAYNVAHQNQVACGDGAWELCLDYADDDVFEQKIAIKPIPDALSVVWDYMSTDPTGKDAEHCFIVSYMREREFKKAYPDARITDFAADSVMRSEARGEGWFVDNTVRVVKFWRMRAELRTLALVTSEDGADIEVLDVTDLPREEWIQRVQINPATGRPYVRRSRVRYAESYVTNGVELLDGPHRMPIPRVPVFRAVGWTVHIGAKVERFGMIRFLKDPQRMHNYWRSVVVEKLMQTPRPKWLAPSTAVEGREASFRNAASSDDPLLVYNDDAGTPPQLMPPAQMEAALIQEAGMAAQDIRDISNLHEASLGMAGNEVSGRAITARQQSAETSVAVYQDNLNSAIEECGRAINRLIPYIYDTARTVRVLGADDKEQLQEINTNAQNDITTGKYDVTIITGPSYATKRREAAESMLNMVNAMPDTLAVAADKIIEAQDWPGAEEIAKRLRASLPPGMVDEGDLSEEEVATRQQAQQQAQQQFEMEMRDKMADIAMKEAQAQDYQARAAESAARAAKSYAEIDFGRVKAMTDQEKAQFEMLIEGARLQAELTDRGEENDV